MGAVIEGLRALGPARLAAMAAVAVCVASFLAVLIARSGGQQMALLYADLDLREAAQIAEQLDSQHIAHVVAPNGTTIMVPEPEVGSARLLLARQGLPSGGSAGYELFDRGDSLTATQFQQQIMQVRALEGELARTIRTISGVRAARVNLVLPHREPFERQQQEAQASVMLTMAGPERLDHEGVQAVVNLVAASVPGLRAHNVAVVDSRGDVLARAGDENGAAEQAQTLEDVRHGIELRLAHAVEEILERTLGPGQVRAEAAVELDTAQLHETQERYDPSGKVERSDQTVSDSNRSSEQQQTVSVQNNLPNPDAGTPNAAGTQQQRQEETTNFEIGKITRTQIRETPEIKRISVAVLVDGTATKAADGTITYQGLPPDELERLTTLARGAVGYDEKRGDKVEVVNLRFTAPEEPPAPATRRILGIEVASADLARIAQTSVIGVLALLGLLLVLRPMVMRLSMAGAIAGGTLAVAGPGGGPGGAAGGGRLGGGMAGGFGLTALPGGVGTPGARMLALTSEVGGADDDGMIEMLNIEGQMRASSVRAVADLVKKHPDASLNILRGWMQQDTP